MGLRIALLVGLLIMMEFSSAYPSMIRPDNLTEMVVPNNIMPMVKPSILESEIIFESENRNMKGVSGAGYTLLIMGSCVVALAVTSILMVRKKNE
jgi:hypothetical protein